jgi:hypothetical protein
LSGFLSTSFCFYFLSFLTSFPSRFLSHRLFILYVNEFIVLLSCVTVRDLLLYPICPGLLILVGELLLGYWWGSSYRIYSLLLWRWINNQLDAEDDVFIDVSTCFGHDDARNMLRHQ